MTLTVHNARCALCLTIGMFKTVLSGRQDTSMTPTMLSSNMTHLDAAGSGKSVSELDRGKAGEVERSRGEMKLCTNRATKICRTYTVEF